MQRLLHKTAFMLTIAAVVFGLVAPASAEESPRRDEADRVERPVERPTDLEVLRLACEARRDDTGNLGAVCRWSTSENARAHQLWRIVDRGHRELVGTFGADVSMTRDDVPDDARLVRYAVLALDVDGDIIGRSRVEPVRFRQVDRPDIDREFDVHKVDRESESAKLRRHARFLI